MKTINRNSWHFKIANFGKAVDRFQWNGANALDICSYTRLFLTNLISVTFMVCVAVVVLGLILAMWWSMGIWIYLMVKSGTLLDPGSSFAIIGILVHTFIGTLALCVYGNSHNWGNIVLFEVNTPVCLKDMYHAWKNKHCYKVKIE